jgi:tRNA dimethylallyltransferase
LNADRETARAPLAAILCGATASGKTAFATELAAHLPIEVISADSRQIYRQLDIGTAKPTAAERAAVAHHLIDFLPLDQTYDAARFAADAIATARAIRARGRIPVVVGGAGFYVHVLRHGLFEPPYDRATLHAVRDELAGWSTEALHAELVRRDPERAAAIHPHDRYRLGRAVEICIAAGTSVTALSRARPAPVHRFLVFHLHLDRATLHARIAARTEAMFAAGWLDEVRGVLAGGTRADAPGLRTLGYPAILAHLRGETTRETMQERIGRETRRFARHQDTWFRKLEDATIVQAGDPTAVRRMAETLRRNLDPAA